MAEASASAGAERVLDVAGSANGAAPADETETAITRPPVQPVADEAIAAAERIAFLALASELARDRSVLVIDDGAGALSGVAAKLDSARLDEITNIDSGAYEVVVADLQNASEGAAAQIDELARVLDQQTGTALVRLPNRPEFATLQARLEAVFARTLALRQHNWISSALLDDKMFANDDPSRAVAASVRKLAAAAPEHALYDVIVATQGAFPKFRPQLALTRSPQLSAALAALQRAEQQLVAERSEASAREAVQEARIRQLEEQLAWFDEHHLAVREKTEQSALAAMLLSLWVAVASNIGRVGRALRG